MANGVLLDRELSEHGPERASSPVYLLLTNTKEKDAVWRLTEERQVVGRGAECDIRVLDPAMSRRHLELWLEDAQVRFRDLGSRNGVLLNGSPVNAGRIWEGDVLAVGGSVFLVRSEMLPEGDELEEEEKTVRVGCDLQATQALAARRVPLALPRTLHELHALFKLAVALGAVESERAFVGALHDILRERFAAEGQWVALERGLGEPLHFSAANGRAQETPDSIVKAARKLAVRAIADRHGLKRTRPGADGGHMLAAAPMLHANQALGALVLCGGATDRPYTEDDLRFMVALGALAAPHLSAVRQLDQLRRDNRALREAVGRGSQLLGNSVIMTELRQKLRQAAAADHLPVLLLGETGVGKEIAAHRIHADSPRRDGPFVVINCAAIPQELFESELFGHVRGAFTGAERQRTGRIEEADGGTLFLDEIADLSPDNQARILRAVESGAFHRVGGADPVTVDVRFVAATNKSLEPPGFRADLLHRLNNITIHLPPLRAHAADIPELARHFLDEANQTGAHAPLHGFTRDALDMLKRHPWPGNVRQLRAAVLRAAAFASDSMLTLEDFEKIEGAVQILNTNPVQMLHTEDSVSFLPLQEIERRYIQTVLDACHGNVSSAAKILGIARGTLYKRLSG